LDAEPDLHNPVRTDWRVFARPRNLAYSPDGTGNEVRMPLLPYPIRPRLAVHPALGQIVAAVERDVLHLDSRMHKGHAIPRLPTEFRRRATEGHNSC